MAGRKQSKESGRARKKVRAGPGRPKDRKRAEMAERVKVLITMLPQMISNSVMNCCRRGDEAAAERAIKEFVYAAKRDDARRIAREIVVFYMDWPVLQGGQGETQRSVRRFAAGLEPEKRKAFNEAWKRVALGLNELESMIKPGKVAAFAHRHVAAVGGQSSDRHSLGERLRRSKIDVVKHAAHDLDEIWKDVRQDRDGELGEPTKYKKKTKKKK